MSQPFENLYASDMLCAFSVILRCAVLYKEFKSQNHTVSMFFVAYINKHSQYELFFYGFLFQCISLFRQHC